MSFIPDNHDLAQVEQTMRLILCLAFVFCAALLVAAIWFWVND